MNRSNEAKAISEFRNGLLDLLRLTRHATGSETAHFHWVNRNRGQFVLACGDSDLRSVAFPDRASFDGHWMSPFCDLVEQVDLIVPHDVDPGMLAHHAIDAPVTTIRLLPARYRGETIALAAFEFTDPMEGVEAAFTSFQQAYSNLLQTHLNLAGLISVEDAWEEYDQRLDELLEEGSMVERIRSGLALMAEPMASGGVAFMARGNGTWLHLLESSPNGDLLSAPGLGVQERSVAYQVLQSGRPEFATHFNRSPVRISPSEGVTEGASFGVPLLVEGRRHGVFLAYDADPMRFTGATCHRIVTVVRSLGLSIAARNEQTPLELDLFTEPNSAFKREAWELSLNWALSRPSIGSGRPGSADSYAWFGMVTIANLPSLRSRLRPQELLTMQQRLIARIAPARVGFNGWFGAHSDYVYSFLLTGSEPGALNAWMDGVRGQLAERIDIGGGKGLHLNVKILYAPLQLVRGWNSGRGGFSQWIARMRSELGGFSERDETEDRELRT